MNGTTWLKLSLIPVFTLLAVGSSSPKKKDGDPAPASSAASATLTGGAAKTGKVLGHCEHKADGFCKEVYSFSLGGEASEKKVCDALNSTYESATPCPTRDTLWGVCSRKDPAIGDEKPELREKISYYDEGPNRASAGGGADVAKGACDALSGEWAPGPASLKPAPAAAKKPAPPKKK
ncbi:hypothetical protein BH11MYX4_BH11MYX4_61730 [soil metagenome]